MWVWLVQSNQLASCPFFYYFLNLRENWMSRSDQQADTNLHFPLLASLTHLLITGLLVHVYQVIINSHIKEIILWDMFIWFRLQLFLQGLWGSIDLWLLREPLLSDCCWWWWIKVCSVKFKQTVTLVIHHHLHVILRLLLVLKKSGFHNLRFLS